MKKVDINNIKKDKVSGLLVRKKNWMKNQGNKNTAIGYCHNDIHSGYLTKNMIKQHGCITKGCRFFQKYDDNPYWKEKEKKKLSKKINKYMNMNNYKYLIYENHYYRPENDLSVIDKIISKYNINSIDMLCFK